MPLSSRGQPLATWRAVTQMAMSVRETRDFCCDPARRSRATGRLRGGHPKAPRILLVTTSYPHVRQGNSYGGMFIRRLEQELLRLGIPCEVRPLPYRERLQGRGGLRACPTWLGATLGVVAAAKWVADTLRAARNAELLHAMWLPSLAVAAFCGVLYGIPVVYTEHSPDCSFKPTRFLRLLGRMLYRFADRRLAVSPWAMRGLRRWTRLPWSTLENGIDPCPYHTGTITRPPLFRGSNQVRPAKVIAVGRLVPIKDIGTLIEGAALAARRMDLEVHIVGDGSERGRLEATARDKLGERVYFHGTCPPDRVCSLLCQSDVFASSSLGETAGYAVVEAALHELPVVATPTGWAARLVENGRTGYRIPPKNPGALAEALVCAARHCTTLGQEARRWAKRAIPTWSETGQNHAALYFELTNPSRGRRQM